MADAPTFTEADYDRECYIPTSPEHRARSIAIWREMAGRVDGDNG